MERKAGECNRSEREKKEYVGMGWKKGKEKR